MPGIHESLLLLLGGQNHTYPLVAHGTNPYYTNLMDGKPPIREEIAINWRCNGFMDLGVLDSGLTKKGVYRLEHRGASQIGGIRHVGCHKTEGVYWLWL